MTLPAMWIRKNMLQSPSPSFNTNERTLTEAEMKVQRSLQKLSIPDWYLNNSSRPPKILSNDAPIESRPPVWKEQPLNKSMVCSTPVMPTRNLTINRNGVLETEIGPPQTSSYGTYRITRNSPTERSPVAKKRLGMTPKSHVPEKKSSRSRLMNVSRTFPRVSPSRKIQNINIVFPPPQSDDSLARATLAIVDPEESQTDMTADSLEVAAAQPIADADLETSRLTDADLSTSRLADADLETSRLANADLETSRLADVDLETSRLADADLEASRLADADLETSRLAGADLETSRLANADLETSRLADADLSTSRLADTSVASSYSTISRLPNQRLTYIKPWRSPAPFASPDAKFSTGRTYNLRASSTPHGSPVSQFSASVVDPEERKNPISSAKPEETLKSVEQPPKPAPRTPKPTIHVDDEMCDACKADVTRRSSPSPQGRPTSGFRLRSLGPIDEKRPITPRLLRPTSSGSSSGSTESPTVAFFTSKRKSAQLENIIKLKESRREGKSLVQEIIEELNEKCRNSAQPTYVTPGSKNFVRKLVRALEKGTLPVAEEGEDAEESARIASQRLTNRPAQLAALQGHNDLEEDDEEATSTTGSEDDAKSAAASTSISYKDTDSSSNSCSDSELRSPTTKHDYSYDWNMNVEKDTNDATVTPDSEAKSDDRDDESVYWIPVTKSKLPRTSSLLSMISRLTTDSPGQQSPCVSPIRRGNEAKKQTTSSNQWGMTYRTSDYARTLRRIDETTVLDSGYSDRSRGHSSGSSDDTWYDDGEATQTASEVGSCGSFSLGSYGSRRGSGAHFVGRPFVI